MRRFVWVLGVLAAVAIAIGGCREQSNASPPNLRPLIAAPFETCAEWTDWRTVCWRPQVAGKKGQYAGAECRANADVKPAEILNGPSLCLRFQVDGQGQTLSVRQRAARLHCDAWIEGSQRCVISTGGGSRCTPTGFSSPVAFSCYRWNDTRPMSGNDPVALAHPWCRQWRNGLRTCDQVNGRLQCRVDDHPIETDATRPLIFSCVKWDAPPSCKRWTDGINTWTHEGCVNCQALGQASESAAYFVRCLEQSTLY